MTDFQLVGIYQITPTEESIAIAARYHKYDWLIDSKGKYKENIVWNNLTNLGLLEFQVFGNYTPAMLTHISQGDQSPYMEFYLDPSGIRCILEKEAIDIEGRRICFFLHFVDIFKPLQIGDKRVALPKMTNLPERLLPYTYYVPVD